MLEEEYIGWVNLHAQLIDSSGTARWGSAGLTVREGTVYPGKHALVADGTGGLFAVWADVRTAGDIYAQRIDAGGTALWSAGGLNICTGAGFKTEPAAAAAGLGGMIVAWPDDRNMSDTDIFAQGVSRTGGSLDLWPTITAVDDVPRDQGSKLTLQWAASPADVYPDAEITHYSVWRRLPGGLPYALDGEGSMVRAIAGASGYVWEWIANVPAKHYDEYALMIASRYDSMGTDPGWQYFVVSAHTGDPLLYYDSPVDSGYSVDNLSPLAPAGLAGEQQFGPAGLALSWSANAESDLGGYAVYRGTSEDFVPGPGNLVATTVGADWFDGDWTWDGGYYYKVAAVDVHGNESGFAFLTPEDVTGSETPAAPRASYLEQNFPNPFNPSTRIAFGLSVPSRVSLRVYDAAGRLVRVLVEEARPAGHYTELWDGLDGAGRAAASGIYFYRLDAGAFARTKKTVLLR